MWNIQDVRNVGVAHDAIYEELWKVYCIAIFDIHPPLIYLLPSTRHISGTFENGQWDFVLYLQ